MGDRQDEALIKQTLSYTTVLTGGRGSLEMKMLELGKS
jgi:hypothetical protein